MRLDLRLRVQRRGAGIVELALILFPLMALFCAIVDISLAIFVRNTLQHAVREGVRYAVTSRVRTGMGHDDSIKAAVKDAAAGLLTGTQASTIHVRYYVPGTLVETPSNLGGNIVEVSVENYTWSWRFPFLGSFSPLNFEVRSSDRMEPSPAGTPPPRQLP